MAVLKNKSDDTLLKNLVPLNTLSDEQLGKLLSRVVTQKAKKGEYLFREGDTDHQNVYLLSGIVALLSGPKEMDMVASGTPTARFALAHQLPRKHSARAKTAVTYVRVDSRMLSDLLARSQSSSYEVTEASVPGRNDWMSLLLQSSVFQQIPPANLQQVMMRMREINVSADDVIIRQGEDGDYFYLISRGMCRVTRQPASDRPPVELAQLKAGQGFGEEALISDNPRGSTVTMLTDGVLVRLNKKDFVELVKQPLSRTIEYAEACDLVDGGNLWLDVRIPEEYEAGHLPGAINMPFFSLRFQASSLASDRTYLIYGNEVGQAATAAYLLVERGYEVFILSQGWHEVAVLSGLEMPELKPPVDNVIDFNREPVPIADAAEASQDSKRAEEAIKALQKQLEDAEQAYGAALTQHQAELDLLKQALGMAKQKLEMREQDARVAEESLGEEAVQLRDLLAQTQAHAQEMESHQKEVVESEGKLRQRVSELEAQLESENQHYSKLQSTLEEELQAVRQQLDDSIATLQQQEQQASEQEYKQSQQLAQLQQQYASAREETEQFRHQAADDLNILQRERDAIQQTLQEQQEKFAAAERGSGERQQQYEAQISVIGQELDDTKDRLSKAESARAELEQSRQQLQDEWSSAESAFKSALAEAVKEKSGLLEAQQSLHQELQPLRLEATELKVDKQRQERALQEAAESQEKLSSEYTAVREELRLERQAKGELENTLQSAEERRAGLEKELFGLRQAGDSASAQHQNTLDALRAELEQARESLAELRSSKQLLESARDESESALNSELTKATAQIESLQVELQSVCESREQEQKNSAALSQSMEEATIRSEGLQQDLEQLRQESLDRDAEHQAILGSLREELTSSQAGVEASQEALQESRDEVKRLDERPIELEALLEQEHQKTEFLRRSLETAEDALEIFETESQQELKAVSEQLIDQQASLDQLDAVKKELEQQLQDHLEEKERSLGEAEKVHRQAIEELEQRLAAADEAAEQALTAEKQREADLQSKLEGSEAAKAELETCLAEMKSNLQSLHETHAAEDTLKQQTIRQLEQDLSEVNANLAGESQSKTERLAVEQDLKAAQLEITQLKSSIEGLREVQLEMESQLAEDAEEEIQALRAALENEEKKRRKAEESARQVDVLRRERAVQETAVEMLGEELEGFEAEKEALVKERDSLLRQLTERQGQLSELMEENNQLQTERSGLREQAEDSGLADDLLTQLETMRSKVETSEQDRDKAKTESMRMKREVRELRSVIETYVEQIQDVQSQAAGDELIALRSELDMVRRQATGDLEEMRQQMASVEAKERDQGVRDVNEAASLQALRQEIGSSQMALNEKEHLLRMSQTHCRTLEDAIEDRDKENDELRRKLELLLRKTGGLGLGSGGWSKEDLSDSQLLFEDTAPSSSRFREGLERNSADAVSAKQRNKFGRLFRKK